MGESSGGQYPRNWLRLSDALSIVMNAGFNENDAMQLIANGIADQTIKIQLGLGSHITLGATAPGKRISGTDVEIPPRINAQDLDFTNSRPKHRWVIPRERIPHLAGYWDIEWLELWRIDVEDLAKSFPASKPRRQKGQAARERACRVIKELFPNGLPDQISNGQLCKRVGDELQRRTWSNVSKDTILRAAGRRK